jgi:hypothetical protein
VNSVHSYIHSFVNISISFFHPSAVPDWQLYWADLNETKNRFSSWKKEGHISNILLHFVKEFLTSLLTKRECIAWYTSEKNMILCELTTVIVYYFRRLFCAYNHLSFARIWGMQAICASFLTHGSSISIFSLSKIMKSVLHYVFSSRHEIKKDMHGSNTCTDNTLPWLTDSLTRLTNVQEHRAAVKPVSDKGVLQSACSLHTIVMQPAIRPCADCITL